MSDLTNPKLITADQSEYPKGFSVDGDNFHALGCRDLKKAQHAVDFEFALVENYLGLCVPEMRERVRIMPCLEKTKK